MTPYDEDLTPAEIQLMQELKGKTRSEKDKILGELERSAAAWLPFMN